MQQNEIPQHIDAETAILGTILWKPEAANEVISKLKVEDFYSGCNRKVYETICILSAKNEDVSVITVAASVGDAVSASDLAQMIAGANVISSSQIDSCIRLIKDASIRRQIMNFGKMASYKATEGEELDDVLSELEQAWYEITQDSAADWEMSHELMMRQMATLDVRYQKKGITGVSTGFPELDRILGGMAPGQLIFVAAVPKMGKTSCADHMIRNAGVPGLFFSLEMMSSELADREIAAVGRVDGTFIKNGNLNEGDWARVHRATEEISKMTIGWVEKTGMTVAEIKAVCRRFQQKHGLGLVVIDQLDKIHEKRIGNESKTDTIGRTTRALKNMAKDLKVPVVVLLQLLDKQIMKRTNPRPQHGDIRDSSYADQDGDVIIYLWRPGFYWPKNNRYAGKAEIIVARQRSGGPGSVWVEWEPRFTSFKDLPLDQWLQEDDFGG
jgi:replicative DNA helicase